MRSPSKRMKVALLGVIAVVGVFSLWSHFRLRSLHVVRRDGVERGVPEFMYVLVERKGETLVAVKQFSMVRDGITYRGSYDGATEPAVGPSTTHIRYPSSDAAIGVIAAPLPSGGSRSGLVGQQTYVKFFSRDEILAALKIGRLELPAWDEMEPIEVDEKTIMVPGAAADE